MNSFDRLQEAYDSRLPHDNSAESDRLEEIIEDLMDEMPEWMDALSNEAYAEIRKMAAYKARIILDEEMEDARWEAEQEERARREYYRNAA